MRRGVCGRERKEEGNMRKREKKGIRMATCKWISIRMGLLVFSHRKYLDISRFPSYIFNS